MAMDEKEYWTIRINKYLKDRLYELAKEENLSVGEALNKCLEIGMEKFYEW